MLPYLYYEDARAALAFLVDAFGFTEIDAVRDDEGNVWHANISAGDGIVMVGPGMSEYGTAAVDGSRPATARTFIYVDDVDAQCERARRAGATVLAEPADQGPNRTCCVRDPGGHQWIFGTAIATST